MQRSLKIPNPSSPLPRPGYLAEVTEALINIRDNHTSGRLSIRNGERFGLAHLYFVEARLVHITGDRSDGEVILNDLLTWSKGSVRFDAAARLTYENLTWQQAQLFTRWVAFLEMRGVMLGIPRTHLEGLTHSLSAPLPGQPIALPQQVEHYEEYAEAARTQQWQRLSNGVGQLIERTLPEDRRQHLQQASQTALHFVGDLVQQAVKATQEGVRHAAELAHETFSKVQSTQRSVNAHAIQEVNETAFIVPGVSAIAEPRPQERSTRPSSPSVK